MKEKKATDAIEEFAICMKEIDKMEDTEEKHCRGDELMCGTLRKLGYGEGVNIFEEMDKWYA